MDMLRTLTVAILLAGAAAAPAWEMQPAPIPTRWAASVTPSTAWPEYPRPQLVRAHWQNLNGLWEYAIAPKDAQGAPPYDGKILVPYPLESALSGVRGALKDDQLLWYHRSFTMAAEEPKRARSLLHFEAVDFEATVYVNGQEVGTHRGGYEHFYFDITKALRSGQNELVVRVWDPTDRGPNPHGKQGIQHTAASGIWQTVWLERVPDTYIDSLTMTPDVDRSALNLSAHLAGERSGETIEAIVRSKSAVVARASLDGVTAIRIPHPRLWSPDDPYLYDLEIRVLRGTSVVDRITSYFGMRKIEVKADSAGVPRIFLNGRYTYNLGTLDRGWWPDGIYTAPSDAALKFDIEATKAMGFNTIRKHVKVEPDRWYYHCDKLGLLVWQDMVNPANFNAAALTSQAREQFEQEVRETLDQLHDHPSIVMWVLFNEGWGAYDQDRIAKWMKQRDPSRLLDAHSGPEDDILLGSKFLRDYDPGLLAKIQDGDATASAALLDSWQKSVVWTNWSGSDLTDIHHYPDPAMPPAQPGKARVLGEYGGIGVSIEDHVWDDLTPGYSMLEISPDKLASTYAKFLDRLKELEAQGLSGSIYTIPFDVEGAQYGLMTYDRAILKIPIAEITRLNSRIIPKAGNYAAATRGFSAADADTTPEAQRYAALIAEYRDGRRESPFLRRMTLMALRQGDQARATAAGNMLIASSEQPYSKAVWSFIRAVTRTSGDAGFEILRAQADAADAVLGPDTAEAKVREVIRREEIEPVLAAANQPPPWSGMTGRVESKYGALGRQAVDGVQMMYALEHGDSRGFGFYFARYFGTASPGGDYPINALSSRVCRQVDDPRALEVAIKTLRWNMEVEGTNYGQGAKDDPTQHDTYACLLYKAGRRQEALTAQQVAVRLSESRDSEINAHLANMTAGQPVSAPVPSPVPCNGKPGVTFICGPRNAEDLVALPGSPWIISSGLADPNGLGGGLYLIDRRNNAWKPLYPGEPPSSSGDASTSSLTAGSDCTAPVEPSRLSAHGIHLREGTRQLHTLYVVNHGSRESIEIFDVDATQEPVIHWKGCLILPGKGVGNSVAPLPNGGIVVTVSNLADDARVEEEVAARRATGYVLEWHAKTGWKRLSGSEGSFPNGIEVSPDGRSIYVTNTGTKDIVRLSRDGTAVRRTVIATGMFSDNVRWDSRGRLWITGQLAECGSEPVCAVPYTILTMDPKTLRLEQVPHPVTAPEFGAATVALPVENAVWVGTYQGDRIARLPL